MFDVIKAYQVEGGGNFPIYNENQTVKMLGDSYDHSATFCSGFGMDTDLAASYNLKGQYKTIKGFIGFVDGSVDFSGKFTVELDGKLYKEYDVNTGEPPQEIAIDVTGVQVIRITATCAESKRTSFAFANVTIE